MQLRTAVLLSATWFQLMGCGSSGLVGDRFRPELYVVRSGDTLYSIAWRYQIDQKDLIRWNKISDPDKLRTGQRLLVQKPVSKEPRRKKEAALLEQDNWVPPRTSAPSIKRDPSLRPQRPDQLTKWVWPVNGKVVRLFAASQPDRRGLDIRGHTGQTIRAAAAGDVVYSGHGLPAYGKLIIVKHDETYLSAYAHNRVLLVNEGDTVITGQRIAEMGSNGSQGAILHFEIRKNGEPVNPLLYLPRRE